MRQHFNELTVRALKYNREGKLPRRSWSQLGEENHDARRIEMQNGKLCVVVEPALWSEGNDGPNLRKDRTMSPKRRKMLTPAGATCFSIAKFSPRPNIF